MTTKTTRRVFTVCVGAGRSSTLVTGCIAPFALSEEVTKAIPQETLGAMITCDFDAITTRFEEFYQVRSEG